MDNQDKIDVICTKLAEATNKATTGACKVAHELGADGCQMTRIGFNAALTAIQSVLPYCLKIEKNDKNEATAKNVIKSMTHETMLFGGLVVAHMHVDSSTPDLLKDGAIGCSMEVSFGPETMSQALRDWVKLTNKNPDDYFTPSLLEFVREYDKHMAEVTNDADAMVKSFFDNITVPKNLH